MNMKLLKNWINLKKESHPESWPVARTGSIQDFRKMDTG